VVAAARFCRRSGAVDASTGGEGVSRRRQRVRDDGNTEVFAKPVSDGSVAVGLFNRGVERMSPTPAATSRVGGRLRK
jgi:Alpha galactosidase C-terminal beta sandwich domain